MPNNLNSSFEEFLVDLNHNDYLNSTTNDLCELFQRKGLYFIPVNARSLLPRVMEIRVLANRTNAAVICVTETWFDSSVTDTEVEIPGYLIQRRDRSRSGGSVCMYIRSDLAFNPRHDLTVEELENIWVEILLPKTKPILVCVCYRPPRQTDFYTILENSLMDVHLQYKMIILGDFNINVKNIDKQCTLIDGMRSFMNLFGMSQLLNCASRITLTSSSISIIDLIFISEPANISQSGVLPIRFSDHQDIYCTCKLFRGKVGTHKSIKLRSCKHYDRTVFNNMLSDLDWNCIYSSKHVDEAWQYFTTHFCSILNRVAPLKEVRVKQRTEPWFD